MKDIQLWHLLDPKQTLTTDQRENLAPLLAELSQLDMRRRLPFLSRVQQLAKTANTETRAQIVNTFAGASGWKAWKFILQFTDDESSKVQLAAANALIQSATTSRWVLTHLVFHPKSDIRVHTVRHFCELKKPLPGIFLYLLMDEHCQAIVNEGLLRWGTTIDVSPRLLLSLHEQRLLSPQLVRRMITSFSCKSLDRCLAPLPRFSESQCKEILKPEADLSRLSQTGRDGLQWMLELFWEQPKQSDGSVTEYTALALEFFDNLFRMLRDYQDSELDYTDRFLASAFLTAHQTGVWNAQAAGYCAALSPNFLLRKDVPLPVRRSAAGMLYELRDRVPESNSKRVRKLLNSSFCRRRNGHLDLWAMGAILHFRHRDGLKILLDEFTVEQIAAAFLANPNESTAFFSYPGSTALRQEILQEIRSKSNQIPALLDATLVYVVPADGLEFLERLNGSDALKVLDELQNFSQRSELKLTERKVAVTTAILIDKLSTAEINLFLQSWLMNTDPASFPIGIEALGLIAREKLPAEQLIKFAKNLAHPELRKLLHSIIRTPAFPYGVEMQFAIALAEHDDSIVRDWAVARAPVDCTTPSEKIDPIQDLIVEEIDGVAFVDLESKLADTLASCPESELAKHIQVCLKAPTRGVCEALAARTEPHSPQLEVCAAILGSADPVTEIDIQFQRFSSSKAKFLESLDVLMVQSWQAKKQLPLTACAWLCRWESELVAFGELTLNQLPDRLKQTRTLGSKLLAQQFWFATKRVLNFWRFREPDLFRTFVDKKLINIIAEELREPHAQLAAEILMAAHHSRLVDKPLAAVQKTIVKLLPETSRKVREILHPWIDSTGLGPGKVVRRAKQSALKDADLEQIARTKDVGQLMQWCRSDNKDWVLAAAERCISLKRKSLDSMLELFFDEPIPIHAAVIGDTVSRWPAKYRRHATDLATYERLDWETRFLICVNLVEAGERSWLDHAVELACRDEGKSWFQREYLGRLQDLAPTQHWLATRLATSPHPYAYQFSINLLTGDAGHSSENSAFPDNDVETRKALRSFLDCGSKRIRNLRLEAAAWLAKRDDWYGYPLLVEAVSESTLREDGQSPLIVFPENMVRESVDTALLAGPSIFPEDKILTLLDLNRHSADAYQSAAIELNEAATSNRVRQRIALQMRKGLTYSKKLKDVAETFAWGIPIARQLTERLFKIQMIGGDDYGYTRLNENKIYINPLPILQRKAGGRDIVEGLILHELGHHMYHRGEQEAKIWKQAENEQLGRLLNLVSDEHLERNLRALDHTYGDRLKKLGAYVFRHTSKEVEVKNLLQSLNLNAFQVLTTGRMKVARRPGCVRLSTRRVLQQLERSDSSFSRFFQAMRLGLGNRHNDPKVAEALKLFQKGFRRSTMQQLYDITVRLREIFGDECNILDCFDQSRIFEGEGSQIMIDGEGMTNEDLQSEIQRIANPERHQKTSGGYGRWINVSERLDFDPITTIQRVHATPSEHANYAKPVARYSNQLRRYLSQLGLVMEPQRRRIRGRGLDRSGLSTAILKSDPRILKLREPRYVTDLFIGVAIDCSGSMEHDDNIEKAKLFGALLTETVRGMSTIDLRVYGFTDTVIYDAGSGDRSGLANLRAEGGNNDAAALLHAAQQAQASRRRAKLLVMISDGLPTECSVEALRSLVQLLTRKWNMCCAQVAVQPLEEICFPNYVLLDTSEPGPAVRQFGLTIARLIRKSMGQSR